MQTYIKKMAIIVLSSLLSIMILSGCGNQKAAGQVQESEHNTPTEVTDNTEINAEVDINSNTNSTIEIITENTDNTDNTTQLVTETTVQPENDSIQTEEDTNQLTLLMVGDILLHTPVELSLIHI